MLANVRSNEPDVKGIVGKLTQGAVDAGFVYASDVEATGGSCARSSCRGARADVDLRRGRRRGRPAADAAQAFVDDLLAGGCHEALLAAGFGEP